MLEKREHIDDLFANHLSDYEEKVPDHVWENILVAKKNLLEKSEHVDDLFSIQLNDYEEKAPDYVWKNIQTNLKVEKARQRASITRAVAASVAIFLAFGIGYFSSDYSKKQIAQNLVQNKDTNLILDQKHPAKIRSNNQKTRSININKEFTTDPSSEFEIKETNGGFLYKIFDKKENNLIVYAEKQREIQKSALYKKNTGEKTSNQLLIDTLFKKENLSERGFLLSEGKVKKSRWSFGTKFSPVYSMAENVDPTDVEKNTQLTKSMRVEEIPDTKSEEKSLLSYSGGLNVNFNLSRRWSIESGLFYSQYRQKAENLVSSSSYGFQDELTVYTPEGNRYIEPTGIADPVSSQIIGSTVDETFYTLDMDYVRNSEYIELPLLVRYKIIDRKFGLDILSGFSTNFLVNNKSSIVYNENDLWTGKDEEISPMLYNATIALGLNYDFYRNLSFNIEPTFKYSIMNSETITTSIKYPYKFAIFAGFSYRF